MTPLSNNFLLSLIEVWVWGVSTFNTQHITLTIYKNQASYTSPLGISRIANTKMPLMFQIGTEVARLVL
jgi:hypothetical protein